jgi:hypothetical protein
MTRRALERVPVPGELAWIDGPANAVYAGHPMAFDVEKVEPSATDVSRGRNVLTATWLYLTGWSVSPTGQRGRHQLIPVLRLKIRTVIDLPAPPTRTCLPRCG